MVGEEEGRWDWIDMDEREGLGMDLEIGILDYFGKRSGELVLLERYFVVSYFRNFFFKYNYILMEFYQNNSKLIIIYGFCILENDYVIWKIFWRI